MLHNCLHVLVKISSVKSRTAQVRIACFSLKTEQPPGIIKIKILIYDTVTLTLTFDLRPWLLSALSLKPEVVYTVAGDPDECKVVYLRNKYIKQKSI